MKKLSWSILFLVLSIPFLTLSCDDDDDDDFTPSGEQTIYELAEADGRFSLLLEAVDRAGLEGTLRGSGSFTLFAPTDDAMQAFLDANEFASLDEAVAAVGEVGLRQILLYHVLGNKVLSADISAGYTNTVAERIEGNGEYLDLRLTTDGGVMIDKTADVVETDIEALNGVIHVINAVVTPRNIVGVASGNEDFTSLVSALGQANANGTQGDLIPVLSADSTVFTVFAPTNDAFAEIQSTVDGLTDEQLADVLLHHVVNGNVSSDQLTSGAVPTLNANIQVDLSASPVTIESETGNVANVVVTDIQTTSGIIHVIDAVLVPQL